MVASLMFFAGAYGFCARDQEWFPTRNVLAAKRAWNEWRERESDEPPRFCFRVWDREKGNAALSNPVVTATPAAYPGVNIMTGVDGHENLFVRLAAMDGKTLHQWRISMLELWPNPTHAAPPQSKSETHLHGIVLLESGDIVFNFENFGLIRLDPCGKVVWRLPYVTHHSVHLDDDGTLWVNGQKFHDKPDPRFPNYRPVFVEPTILQVRQDGTLKQEISVFELLQQAGYPGLLYLTTQSDSTEVGDDTLHLNDVEPFPRTLAPGVFQRGDVMISLRNSSTVLVFELATQKIKFIRTGQFIRQHDPDFVDGNTISVFDNGTTASDAEWYDDPTTRHTRIVMVNAATNESRVYYQAKDFFTGIMGKHQWLPNGNLLITSPMQGRAFEVDPQGQVVWDYLNMVNGKYLGLMEEVRRYPPAMADAVVARAARCPR
jgi:hypothetical protein